MKLIQLIFILMLVSVFNACNSSKVSNKVDEAEAQLQFAEKQISLLLNDAIKEDKIPRTVTKEGKTHWIHENFDWTEGFFPGTCWYLYEVTKDVKWKNAAIKFQQKFENHKNYTANHDLGFVFNSSFGNGFRLTKNNAFKEVLITAGNSLLTRFNPNVGCIQSWDVHNGWQAQRGWEFPVIIDNMMNLELLFKLTELTGDKKYKNVAISHADTTLKNHFRADNSSYHLIDYDPKTGAIRNKHTAQGYADESAWARGQAWAVYGYTICYRFTKDKRYLKQAEKIANYIINYPNTPKDGIPYWDYNAPNIPNEPRDASAAAITAAALIELDGYSKKSYTQAIHKIMKSLASDAYTAKLGENNNFILKHSVGSIPHNNEINVPLNYADYYYLEALIKYKKLALNY